MSFFAGRRRNLAIFLVSLFTIAACSSLPFRGPSSVDGKPRHVVITLHGLRGNAESYGDFHKIAKANLEAISSEYRVETYNWTFPVGAMVDDANVAGGVWNPHLIARKFNDDFFLGRDAKLKDLGPQDKISIIAYSMGGLMAMTWYYDSMFNFLGHPELAYSSDQQQIVLKNLALVQNVVGLGAVYWGSLDSEFGWSVLKDGSLSEVRRNWPQLVAFCERPETKSVIDAAAVMNVLGSKTTSRQKSDAAIRLAVKQACASVNFIGSNPITSSFTSIPSMVLSPIVSALKSKGNVHPSELDNMRLTSDVIGEMRLNRIRHLLTPDLKSRFRARWTSIAGVFPCLGKADQGVTCTSFSSPDYKRLNDGFVQLFSGTIRRETDGPVLSPSAVADFLFYNEAQGREDKPIAAESFFSTKALQQDVKVQNEEIFVENMHATVVPALEALTGSLKSIGQSAAESMKSFDASLGTDVVIVNSECGDPKTCRHPNYKHVLNAVSACDSARGAAICNQDYLNSYFGVSEIKDRGRESEQLAAEMGSFAVTLNIRLPLGYEKSNSIQPAEILKYLRFSFVNHGSGSWGENRVDAVNAPYGLQIARPSELMSSYSDLKAYSDSTVLKVFLIGRAWPKSAQDAGARATLQAGVPMSFELRLPGVQARRVTAKVKPTYTTYIDLYMK